MVETSPLRANCHSSNTDQLLDIQQRNLEISSWISDDDEYSDPDFDSSVDSHMSLHFSVQDNGHLHRNNGFSGLELIPPDLSVVIFQHLTIQEVSSVSQVCKAMYAASRNPDLWKSNFSSRWNFRMPGDDIDWFRSYMCAYKSCHDLWLTHWNVVYPCDSLSPGRCCINEGKNHCETNDSKKYRSRHTLSPFFRFGDSDVGCTIPDVVKTRAQAVGTATALRLHQHSDLKITQYSTRRARRAFSKSATLNRRIATHQFAVQSLSFLTDVLFFNVDFHHDEFEKLEEKVSTPDLQDNKDTKHCLHSWHLVHFSNPDFNKPMKWRVAVQRPDCFTVYPSEGYLRPGATQVVVFGVTPLSSYLVQPKHQSGSKPCELDDVCVINDYSAHMLPPTPFQVQYQYVAPIPCNTFQNSSGHHSRFVQSNIHPRLRSVWDGLSGSHLGIRTMCLAAHVHSSFPLHEFRRNTLVPFDIHSSCERLHVFCAPGIVHLDPSRTQELENLSMESENSARGKLYRTEGPCKESGIFWGERLEELANSFFAEKVLCEIQRDRRNEKAKIAGELLRFFVDEEKKKNVSKQTIWSAFSIFQTILIEYQDARWLSRRQMHVFAQWKSTICRISNDIGLGGFSSSHESIPALRESDTWTHAKKNLVMTPELLHKSFMEEFEGNSISGVKMAACVMYDPKILQSFGAFERVSYPGRLYRLSQFDFLPKLNFSDFPIPKMKLKALICSKQKLAYYRCHNSLDVDALCLVDSFCCHDAANHDSNVFPYTPFLGNTNRPEPDEISAMRSGIHAFNSHTQTAPEARFAHDHLRDNGAFPQFELQAQQNGGRRRLPRLLRLFVYLSTRLALFVDGETNVTQCFIDRRILISMHWISISLMFLPLFSTLLARYFMLIPSTPIAYSLEGLPFSAENKLRYLTAQECGYAAVPVTIVWMVLGRWIERYTDRRYLRALLEHQPVHCQSKICFTLMRAWDAICPLFLQRIFFLAPWNSRSERDVTRHAAFWRSHIAVKSLHSFDTSNCHSPVLLTFGEATMEIGDESKGWKPFLGIMVAVSTFWISSPHMGLNALSIFMNSLSSGVSFSLQSAEVGRNEIVYQRTGSVFNAIDIVSVVLLSSLVGQMVGSSGGILFLAEFIVTSVSLLLGGAGTMSVDTMQSWFTFLLFSSFATLGYAIGRAATMQGTQNAKRCLSSILLCTSIILAPCSWWIMAISTHWGFPVPLLVHRPTTLDVSMEYGRVFGPKDLQ